MEYGVARRYGVFHTIMDPTKPEVIEFLDNFISEMVPLFPDAYFHIGGDEVEDTNWRESESIQAYMKEHGLADSFALQTDFNKKILPIIERNGKKMIGWDEIFQPDLPKSTVIQSWRGQKSLAEAAKQGYMGILSNGYYIDLFFHAEDHYKVHPLTGEAANLSDAEKARILGGEATMWGELISPEVVDSRIWPRAAAIGERLWSPVEVDDADDMYRRLAVHSQRLELLGLNHRTFQRLFLERIADGRDMAVLQTLATALEPVKSYRRHVTIKHASFMPLNKFVDALPSDNMAARAFNDNVKAYLAGQEVTVGIENYLANFSSVQSEFMKLYGDDPMVNDLLPIVADLSEVAKGALISLQFLQTKEQLPADLKASISVKLNDVVTKHENWNDYKPIHMTEIACLQGMRSLIEAAGK
jgi:hexosaminidase